MNSKDLFGLQISTLSASDLIYHTLQGRKHPVVGYVNAHIFVKQLLSKKYKKSLERIDYLLCDGVGISLAFLLKKMIVHKIAAGDYAFKLFEYIQIHNLNLLIVGHSPATSQKAVLNLQKQFPSIQARHLPVFSRSPHFEKSLIDIITYFPPDVILLGLPHPLQEEIVLRLPRKSTIFLTGGFLEELSGENPRAPKWMRMIWLEWFFRLVQRPLQRWRRYLIGIPFFLVSIFILRFHEILLPKGRE